MENYNDYYCTDTPFEVSSEFRISTIDLCELNLLLNKNEYPEDELDRILKSHDRKMTINEILDENESSKEENAVNDLLPT